MKLFSLYSDEIFGIFSFLSFHDLYSMKCTSRHLIEIISTYLGSHKQLPQGIDGIYCSNVHLFLRDTNTGNLPDIIPHSRKIQEKTVQLIKKKLGRVCKSLELSLDILTPTAYSSMVNNMNIENVTMMLPNTPQTRKLMKRKVNSSASCATIDGHTKDKRDMTLLRILNWVSFRNLVCLNFRGNVGSFTMSKEAFPNLKNVHLFHTGKRTISTDVVVSFAMLGLNLLAIQNYLLVLYINDTAYIDITNMVRNYKPKSLVLDPLPLAALKELQNYGGVVLDGTTFIEEEYNEAVSILA